MITKRLYLGAFNQAIFSVEDLEDAIKAIEDRYPVIQIASWERP